MHDRTPRLPVLPVTGRDLRRFKMKERTIDSDVYPLKFLLKKKAASLRGPRTEFVEFDSRECKACWKCIDACPRNVFGKINILMHKHAVIVRADKCSGCGKCIKACEHGAIRRKNDTGGCYE